MTRTRAWHLSLLAVAASVLIASVGSAGFAQTEPFIGTWKLNIAKSKYSPGPAPKSGMATISTAGQGVKVVVSGVSATEAKVQWEYTANHDGKDYPVTGNPDADTISLKRINASSVETTQKKGGKVTLTNVRTVSADGKTMTVTTKGTNAAGQAVNNVQVFEK